MPPKKVKPSTEESKRSVNLLNTRSNSASPPLPTNAPSPRYSQHVTKTPSCLEVTSPSSRPTLNTGFAASTGKKKNADLPANAPITSTCSGSSSNLLAIPSTSSSTAPEASGSSSVTENISNILSTAASMEALLEEYHSSISTSVPGDSTDLATPASPTIPGSSGPGLPPLLPPNWENRYIATYNSSSIYKTFPVDRGSSEFQTIAGLVSPYRATTVEQIINPKLWQSFAEKWKAILTSKYDVLNTLARGVEFSEEFTKDPRLKFKFEQYSVNEALLLHCTKNPANLKIIMAQGLDERLGEDLPLGRGLYFSDDPEKSVQYDGTRGTILVFGVLLGDCLSEDELSNNASLVMEPEKEEVEQRRIANDFFDSITARGDAAGGYNDYVIFNRNQCYPFYIVQYQSGLQDCDDTEGSPDVYDPARKSVPPIAWRRLPDERLHKPSYLGRYSWPFYATSIFEVMEGEGSFVQEGHAIPSAVAQLTDTTIDTRGDVDPDSGAACVPSKRRKVADEKCFVCSNQIAAYCFRPSLWEKLNCNHRICRNCFKIIKTSWMTMSGMLCESVICPLCKEISGIELGDCPDGVMTVSYVNPSCRGFAGNNSIKINYVINSGLYKLNRTAYLPNSQEGKEILELLITAWDRRLTFMIGTSMETGQQNGLFWNIWHKTSRTGGKERNGYPDEGYLSMVSAQLIRYGIE